MSMSMVSLVYVKCHSSQMLEEQLQAFEVFLEDSVDDDVEHNLNVRCICRRSEVGVDELG